MLRNNRILYLDVLRIIASAMVVMIHSSGCFLLKSETCGGDWDATIFNSLSSCAVPIFFMISGALMLSPDYQFSIKKVLHKILKIAIIWVVWGIVYAISDMEVFSLEKLAIWTFKGHFHFWFFEYLVAIYLLFPILRALVEYNDGRYVLYFLICWFVFGILAYTLNGISWHNEEIRIITGKFHFELISFSGYFVLGHYLSTHSRTKWAPYIFLVIFLTAAFIQFVVEKQAFLSIGTYSFTPLVLIEAISLFLFCKSTFEGCCPKSSIASSSAALTLGIYIIHPFILEHCVPDFLWGFPLIVRVIAVFAYAFITSGIITYVLNSIPFVRKWFLSI